MTLPNDEVAGMIDVIANEEPGGIPDQDTSDEAPKSEPVKTETPAEEEVGDDEQDFSRNPVPETPAEAEEEPSKVEAQVVEEDPAQLDNWKESLPPPPAKYQGKTPEVNEDGFVVNMTPAEYEEYIISRAQERSDERNYQSMVENRALDYAERILPELKTNPVVRQMVENTRVASILTGNQIDTYEAAKQVKEALGLSTARVAEARAQGAQNAKASITVQKAAALQTNGSNDRPQVKSRDTNLSKRLSRGDEDAFAELLQQWDEEGKL